MVVEGLLIGSVPGSCGWHCGFHGPQTLPAMFKAAGSSHLGTMRRIRSCQQYDKMTRRWEVVMSGINRNRGTGYRPLRPLGSSLGGPSAEGKPSSSESQTSDGPGQRSIGIVEGGAAGRLSQPEGKVNSRVPFNGRDGAPGIGESEGRVKGIEGSDDENQQNSSFLLSRVASLLLLISPFFFWGTSMAVMKVSHWHEPFCSLNLEMRYLYAARSISSCPISRLHFSLCC